MIDLNNLIQNPKIYKKEQEKRFKDAIIVDQILEKHTLWKNLLIQLEDKRKKKNDFNKAISNLKEEEKQEKIFEMKLVSDKIQDLERETKKIKLELDNLVKKIGCILALEVPLGKNDEENVVQQVYGKKPDFDFEPKPYWELPVYKKYVDQKAGTKAMGSRGFYLKGRMAQFQKAIMDYALEVVIQEGYDLMYVPLMLNEKVLTGTGHLPDFDGQQYEVKIDEDRSFYLIGSSEPAIMGYYMDENLDKLEKPLLLTCQSSCFRKEAGSYGKDQQGILRVHQFEKVEMVVICKPEITDLYYLKHRLINESILNGLELHFHREQICSGDMPHKHYNQEDFCAYFPSQNRFREVGSNGNASDFQNRGLNITYINEKGQKKVPFGLNCTAVTFRTGLAILEQFQTKDGRVKLPQVLATKMGIEYLE